jgi:hypothetical protein
MRHFNDSVFKSLLSGFSYLFHWIVFSFFLFSLSSASTCKDCYKIYIVLKIITNWKKNKPINNIKLRFCTNNALHNKFLDHQFTIACVLTNWSQILKLAANCRWDDSRWKALKVEKFRNGCLARLQVDNLF